MSGGLRIAIVLVLAAAATIVANVVLLGVASGPHDPVGRLGPRAAFVSSPPPRAATVVSPSLPPVVPREHEHADD